jgi:TP901 family phage tail tape measure protein
VELKSLVEIEIASESAKKGSDEIVSGLDLVDSAAIKATESTSRLNKEFDKTNKTISGETQKAGNEVEKSAKKQKDSMTELSDTFEKSAESTKTFAEAVEAAVANNVGEYTENAKDQLMAYAAAALSASAAVNKFITDNSEFEDGVIGVAKTTNLAGSELEDFKNRILRISGEIPVATNELLDLAQAAGQMGVRGADNLEEFALVMAKVGRTTDLAGEDAARGLARILTVSGESTSELGTLADVIVRMGNNSKATESEIAGMTTKIAQALSVYGIASAESVGLAAAMKSIGITAELGGSAVGRSMQEITAAVLGGDAALNKFSKSLAIDPQKLKQLFETDKIEAFTYFLEGVKNKGQAAGIVLKDIGLGGTEIANTMIPLASNIDLVTNSLKMANDEKEKGGAVDREAAAAFGTFNNQLLVTSGLIKKITIEQTGGMFKATTETLTSLNESIREGGLNRLVDVISLAAIAITARFIPSLFAAETGIISNTLATIRYNFALAQMAGVSRTAAVAQIALSGAMATGNAALALMGGPAGVVLLAAGALAYFAMRTTDAEARLEALGNTTDDVVSKINKLGEAQKELAVFDLGTGLSKAEESLKNAKAAFDVIGKAADGVFKEETFKKAAADVETATEKVNSLKDALFAIKNPDAFKKMQQDAYDLEHAFDVIPNAVESATNAVVDLNEESEKLLKTVKKQADLYFNKSEAAEYSYDLEHGLIARSSKDIEGQILAQYKLIDARNEAFVDMDRVKAKEDILYKKEKDREKDRLESAVALSKKLNDEQVASSEKLTKFYEEEAKKNSKPWEEAAERIDASFADAWSGSFDSFTSFRDAMTAGVKQLVGELIHSMTTKKLTDAFRNMATGGLSPEQIAWNKTGGADAFDISPSSASFQAGAKSSGSGSGIAGVAASINPWAVAAVAVVAGASIWNKLQDEKFVKMTAEYKQGNQGLSKVLGEGNKKSDTLNNSIEKLKNTGGEALGVNYSMLQALMDIRTGITGVAAGFAKTGIGSADYESMGIKENSGLGGFSSGLTSLYNKSGIGSITDKLGALGDFADGVFSKIASAISSKKTKVIDSGIQIFGDSLKNIIDGGTLQAKNYADVKTTKKFLGVTTSTKLKRTTEDLDSTFESQFSDVFRNAGEALEIASKTFGIKFDDFANQLLIKTQDLSLKGLEGEALTKEIESFFGSTMDSWAETLLGGTNVLIDFQKVGETAFDTMIRLASETESFKDSAKLLNLNLKATTLEAVYATQAFADVAGGFDSLSSKLSNYYSKFFTEEEKLETAKEKIVESFKKMNLAIPSSREGFKDLMSSMDIMTDSGREGANNLLDLVDLMDVYYKSIEKSSGATQTNTDALEEQARAAEAAAEAEKERIKNLSEYMVSFSDRIALGKLNDFGKEIFNLNKEIESAVEAAKKLGASESDLAIIMEAETISANEIFISQIEKFNQSIKDAADNLREVHDEISSLISESKGNISSSISKILGVDSRPTIESLKSKLGKGTTKEQISSINTLGDAISTRYDEELAKINEARDAAKNAYESENELKKQAAENQLSAAKQMYEYSLKLKETADSLLLSDLTTLLPQQKLDEAKRQFESASPDQMAGAAQSYLQNARDYYASSADYTAIFEHVQSKLRGASNGAEASLANAQYQYDRQISAVSAGFDDSIYAKQIAELQNSSVVELENLQILLDELQTQSDLEFSNSMLDLSVQLAAENEAMMLELQQQTIALNLIPEKLTETNAALANQLLAATELLNEARAQSISSSSQNSDLVIKLETLTRRVEELTNKTGTGNKP